MTSIKIRDRRIATLLLAGIALAAVIIWAQTPATGPILSFTATTANISGANETVRIDVLRWSTDAERDGLLTAWAQPGAGGGAAAAGRAAAARAAATAAAPDPTAVDDGAPPPAAGRGKGAGKGGKGGDGGAVPAAKPTPESSLTAALGAAQTVGYLWSSEVAGYALRSAVRLPAADGGERVLFITDRRLGGANDLWKPAGSDAPSSYQFSVIELHLNAKGEGEGKVSLTGKVAADGAAKTIALENYGASPVVLKNVKRR
jgi:hypothetical protein